MKNICSGQDIVSCIKMVSDDEDVVLLWNWVEISFEECNGQRYWMHPINAKRVSKNMLMNFIMELHKDEEKFQTFTRMSYGSFD